jgi:hypothetical protein
VVGWLVGWLVGFWLVGCGWFVFALSVCVLTHCLFVDLSHCSNSFYLVNDPIRICPGKTNDDYRNTEILPEAASEEQEYYPEIQDIQDRNLKRMGISALLQETEQKRRHEERAMALVTNNNFSPNI